MDYFRHQLTHFAGFLASKKIPGLTPFFIKQFIKAYQVDMQQAAESNPHAYPTFNAFFTRALKEGIRPIDDMHNSLVNPADGVISQLGTLQDNLMIQAKGHQYTVEDLLANDDKASLFKDGFYSTIYLSPKDYHRVHMPLSGKCNQMTYIPGKILPVKLKTAATVPNLFAINERVVCYFETAFGKMAVILVGATIVGSIEVAWHGVVNGKHPGTITTWDYDEPISLEKGQEMGRFNIGSTVIVLCENQPDKHWQIDANAKDEHMLYGLPLAQWV